MKHNCFKFTCLITFLLVMLYVVTGCQKEKVTADTPALSAPKIYLEHDGASLVAAPAQDEITTEATDRDGEFRGKPKYPYYPGSCRIIFKVRGFDPEVPFTGGNLEPCPHSSILFQGYSQPNGQGALLFSGSQQITGDWQEFIIPSGGYVRFIILEDLLTGSGEEERSGPCKFKFQLADFGWNRAAVEWWNISYGQWLPVIAGRYAPKDLSGYGNLYDEYLCDSWCTWTMDVNFYFLAPPESVSIAAQFLCYYDHEVNGDLGPSIIANHYIWTDEENHQLPVYPIDLAGVSHYVTKAKQLSPSEDYNMWYNVLGFSGQIGSFFWGLAPYGASTSGTKCNLIPDPH